MSVDGTNVDWGLVLIAIAKEGLPLVAGIFANAKNGKPVTVEEWEALIERTKTPGDVLVPKRST